MPAPVPTDDLTLVQRVRSGDQRAFKLLVERYQRKVYAVALGMVKDKEEARDVAQEAFVKVYRYLDHFKGDASFYTWLYRITVNISIDAIRKKGGARDESAVEFDESVKMDVAEKIHARDPSRVVPWRKSADEDLDEHYAKFQVPDDLDW